MVGSNERSVLGGVLCQKLRERAFKCELVEVANRCLLKFYVLPAACEDRLKTEAVGELLPEVFEFLNPPGMPNGIPENASAEIKREFQRKMDRGILIEGVSAGFEKESKQYVVYVGFHPAYLESAKRIQGTFGQSRA